MGLLGQGWDDPKSAAIMALAGGLMQGNMGAGLLGANQAYQGSKADALKRQIAEAELADLAARTEERRLKPLLARQAAEARNRMIYGDGTAPGAGAYQLGPDGMGPALSPGSAPAAGGLIGYARSIGIPDQIIQADMELNGGKKIAEMINARTAPKWTNVNGNLVNENAPGFQGGFQAGMSSSADGKVTAWQPDGRGSVVVGAPAGALKTYGAYRGVDEMARADADLQTVTPKGQDPQITTRGALLRNPSVARITPQQQAALDSDRPRILDGELRAAQQRLQAALSAGDQSGAQRAQGDIASLQREMGGRGATVGMPLQSEEDRLRGTKGVEGDAKANETRAADVRTAQKYISVARQAANVLKEGPTDSGLGSARDKVYGFFGHATKEAVAAQRLSALGGWLTANVPRMEGPQSNFDVGNYQRMAADVGNDMLPVARREAALKTITEMMEGIVNGGGKVAPEASWEPAGRSAIVDALPKRAATGARARDTTTGKVLRFNGMSWVEEK